MRFKVNIPGYSTFILLFVILPSFLNAQSDQSTSKSIDETVTHYHPKVIGVAKNGMIKGKESLSTYLLDLQKEYGTPQNFESHIVVPVNKSLDYELGSLHFGENNSFAQMIIWNQKDDHRQKIFEVMYKEDGTKDIPAGINQAREKWIQLCNTHNAQNLVNELYTEDAIYFNRGRIIIGQSDLAQEYSYMNSPQYRLHLDPLHIQVIDDATVFEVGRCSGSYPLPYLIVWKKQANNNWKVYLDSNY